MVDGRRTFERFGFGRRANGTASVDGGALLALLFLALATFSSADHRAEAAAGTSLPGTSTPDEALAALRAGNRRFTTHKLTVRDKPTLENISAHNAKTQTPFASIL